MFIKRTAVLISMMATLPSNTQELLLKGISFLSTRPQSILSEKNISVLYEKLYRTIPEGKKKFHLAITSEYKQSFQNSQIAQTLFGTNTLTIAGSAIQERPQNALVADYFGLSPAYQSTVFIRPQTKTGTLTLDYVFSLGDLPKNIYIKSAIPLCIQQTSLGIEEIANQETTPTSFPAGYMDINNKTVKPFAESFKQAVAGNSIPGSLKPLIKGKIESQHRWNLADIPITIGCHLKKTDIWGITLEIASSIPIGTEPKSIYLFEPVIGNGREPTMGLGIISYVKVWEDFEQYAYMYFTGHLAHSFDGTQYRSFDFKKNGFLSRYLLVKEFDSEQNATGTVVPAVNITTLKCNIHHALIFNGTALFSYTHKNFFTDLGYNGFIKSKDKITLKENIPVNKYGIKGTQYMFDAATNTVDNSTASTISINQGSLSDQTRFADHATTFIKTEDLLIDSAQMPLSIIHTFFGSIGYHVQEQNDTQTVLPFYSVGAEVSLEGLDLDHVSTITKHSISEWSIYFKGGFTF